VKIPFACRVRNCVHALDLRIYQRTTETSQRLFGCPGSECGPFDSLALLGGNALTACGAVPLPGLEYVDLDLIPSGWQQGPNSRLQTRRFTPIRLASSSAKAEGHTGNRSFGPHTSERFETRKDDVRDSP
jgi:hypothetical protein